MGENRYIRTSELDNIIDKCTESVFAKYEGKVTEKWIEKVTLDVSSKITENISQVLQTLFEEKLTVMEEHLNSMREIVAEHTVTLSEQTAEISALKSANSELTITLDEMNARIDNLENSRSHSIPSSSEIEELSERVEERTNRQLRQTLIFKGIPEGPNEKNWADTRTLLAKTIATSVNTHEEYAIAMLNRVHRGRPNPRKQGKRDIYANLYHWDQCELLLQDFRKLNINGQSSVRVEYKYGPRTTWRRNQALIRRKELKESGEIVSGYVAYPARLMVKRPGTGKNEKYVEFEDFSKLKYAPVLSDTDNH